MKVLMSPQTASTVAPPVILFVDMQCEYQSKNRQKFISSAGSAISNCAKLLWLARELEIPVAHFRLMRDAHEFNRTSKFSHWIDAVRPRPDEYVYERSHPSCFEAEGFAKLVWNVDKPEIIVAGLGAEMACFVTIIDGYNRGCRMTFVDDCSACCAIGAMTEEETQTAVRGIISSYCEIVTLQALSLQLEFRMRRSLVH